MNALAKMLNWPLRGRPTLAGMVIDPDYAAKRGVEPQTIPRHRMGCDGHAWVAYNDDGTRASSNSFPLCFSLINTYENVVARRASRRAMRKLAKTADTSFAERYSNPKGLSFTLLVYGVGTLGAGAYILSKGLNPRFWQYAEARHIDAQALIFALIVTFLAAAGVFLLIAGARLVRKTCVREARFSGAGISAKCFDGSILTRSWTSLTGLKLAQVPTELQFEDGLQLNIFGPKPRSREILRRIERERFPERYKSDDQNATGIALRTAIITAVVAIASSLLAAWVYIPDNTAPRPHEIGLAIALMGSIFSAVTFIVESPRRLRRYARWERRFWKSVSRRLFDRPFLIS